MRHHRRPFILGFLAVPATLYVVLVIWPYIETFYYSLTDWSGVGPPKKFVGLDNYVALFTEKSPRVFMTALWHNVLLLITLPVVTIAIALFLAFMLNVGGSNGVRGIRGSAFYRVVFFFPQVLSVGILAVLFGAMYRSDGAGLLNGVLLKLHLTDADHPFGWMADPDFALWGLLIALVWWWTGFYLVLFSAAMQSIPKDVFEAAVLDGATRTQTFVRITLPLLRDSIQIAWVYLAIVAMDGFALVNTLTVGGNYGGGPDHHSEVIASLMFREFLQFGHAGAACAMGVVIMLLTLLVSAVALRATRAERIEF